MAGREALALRTACRLCPPSPGRPWTTWLSVGPQASVTGPLVRGDVAVVRQHLEALKDGNPHLLRLYAELTELSRPLARARGLTPEGEAALAHTLAELVVQQD